MARSSGYRIRRDQADEARLDRPCGACGHRLGGHRDLRGECLIDDCACVIHPERPKSRSQEREATT